VPTISKSIKISDLVSLGCPLRIDVGLLVQVLGCR
jgi:hypothetical protein